MGWWPWTRTRGDVAGVGPGPDPAVPRPLTHQRVRAWLTEQGYAYFVDGDGDLGGLWRSRLFFFFVLGDDQEILQVRGQWNRSFAIERMPELLELCNAWNGDRVWPKAYLRVRDDGSVHAVCEVSTDLGDGVTDAQLDELLACGLSSAAAFFDELDEAYPDPAGTAP